MAEVLEVVERVSNGEAVLIDEHVAEAELVEYAVDDPERPLEDGVGES
jgi:hypothetical protein